MEVAEIILGCKKGNRIAQKLLFEKYAGLFYAVSKRYTPNQYDPMDNLHDGFIKIYENIGQFDAEKGHFESWARKIVINCALQKLRKKSHKNEVFPEVLNDSQQENFDVVEKMNMDQLFKVIEQLPDMYKQVFCMYEIEGYSHKEIGDMIGIKEVTSRSNLNRSKKMLRKLLIGNHSYFLDDSQHKIISK